MCSPKVNDTVRLMRNVPELSLGSGAMGVVQSVWFAPTNAYEVEFRPQGESHPVRTLVLAEHIQAAE